MLNPNQTGLRTESELAEADPIRSEAEPGSAGTDPNPNPECRNRSESELGRKTTNPNPEFGPKPRQTRVICTAQEISLALPCMVCQARRTHRPIMIIREDFADEPCAAA